MTEYVDVKDLPSAVQAALKSVHYGSSNIQVVTVTTVQLGGRGSGDGRRAFSVLVNLESGQFVSEYGSWGGQNMFDRVNPVDNDDRTYTLPGNGVAILGTSGGGGPVWAQLHIPAAMVSHILTAGPVEPLPTVELDALYCYGSYKSGPYRKEELHRRKVTDAVLDSLVERGLLKRARNGATQITTSGRNAVGTYQPKYQH